MSNKWKYYNIYNLRKKTYNSGLSTKEKKIIFILKGTMI